jgi:hypothetical protein
MANKNFLQAINEVLIRLRETPVTSPNDNSYSRLIGVYINDAKRQVEDSYTWNALTYSFPIQTQDNIFRYLLTDVGHRFRVLDVVNEEKDWFLSNEYTHKMNELFLNQGQVLKGPPDRYNFNGTSSAGDPYVDLYPVPDGVYNVYFNMILPTPELVQPSDPIIIPSEPVILLAYSKALVERGEDGGINTNEAYQLYQQSLADHIAIEANRYEDEITWVSY